MGTLAVTSKRTLPSNTKSDFLTFRRVDYNIIANIK